MKRALYILLTLLLCCCNTVPVEEINIEQCQSLPEVRACATMFAYEGKVYVFGGHDDSGKYHNDLYEYDEQTDQWQKLGQTPLKARIYPISVVVDGKAYIGLGYSGQGVNKDSNYLVDFWSYDIKQDKWVRLADYPSRKANNAICFATDGYIYAGLGFHEFTNELYRYDINADKWSVKDEIATFPTRCTGAVAAGVGKQHFVGTGFRKNSKTDWYEYIEADNKWLKRTFLPYKGRYNAACATTSESAYIFGGWHYGDTLTNGFYFGDILRYDVAADRWFSEGSIPAGNLMNMQAAATDNYIYFGLGEAINGENKRYIYRFKK